MRYCDVYVDDFIGLAQGNHRQRRQIKRALLHSLDRVLRPLEDGDSTDRQEPASVKKMLKGDAAWTTEKSILGWIVNTKDDTVRLPPHRIQRLLEMQGECSVRYKKPSGTRTQETEFDSAFLQDFKWLALSLAERPTKIAEIIPDRYPDAVGACDAAVAGMGGVWFVPTEENVQPTLWR